MPLVLADNSDDPAVREQFRRVVGAYARRRPELISDLLPSNRVKRNILRNDHVSLPTNTFLDDVPLITLDQAEWRPVLKMFARKMILALHYRFTGSPLSPAADFGTISTSTMTP